MKIEYCNTGSIKAKENTFVTGYAATFEAYKVGETQGVKYYQQISKDAFKGCDLSEVVFSIDETDFILARTSAGTLKLSVDSKGLSFIADLGKTKRALNMLEDIRAGNYEKMSFTFSVDKEHYNEKTHTRVIDRIKKVYRLYPVAFAADQNTSVK